MMADVQSLTGLRVLVVEDWQLIADELVLMLESLGCAIVGPAASLDEATQRARTDDLDVAILDLNLDGDEVYPVADELLARGIPFIFTTGFDADNVLPAEFQSWPRLEKPFDLAQLERELRQVIARPSTR
jgi:CheY-like chemotaxis protein